MGGHRKLLVGMDRRVSVSIRGGREGRDRSHQRFINVI